MNAAAMSINHGPFKGAEFQPSEGFSWIQEDGTVSTAIRLSILTQLFLEQFPPIEGWSVEISGDFVQVDMVPLPRREDPMAAATHVPTARFVATLTNPEGRVIGRASSLWTIQGPTDWEKGETNARSRLYEAMGLQSRFGEAVQGDARRRAPALATVSNLHQQEQVKPVTVTPIVNDAPKAPETAEAEKASAETSIPDATTEAEPAKAPEPETTPAKEAEKHEPEAKATPKRSKAATKAAEQSAEAAPTQSKMDVGEEDPLQLPPPAAMLSQIERLAKLMQKPMPTLATRQQAMDFLAELQGKGG